MKYKVSIIQFDGEGETLTTQSLYEQTVESLDVRGVIQAVNAEVEKSIELAVQPRKRAPRSDKGKRRTKLNEPNPV